MLHRLPAGSFQNDSGVRHLVLIGCAAAAVPASREGHERHCRRLIHTTGLGSTNVSSVCAVGSTVHAGTYPGAQGVFNIGT
jgi:hypothetical protein